jgi:hypothetical protein
MSSKRAVRRRACAGKVRHPDTAHAWRHARRLIATYGQPYHVYRCRFCGGAHVAHGDGRKVAA